MTICAHSGWGRYSGEEGPCPPPAEMVEIEGGSECPACRSHVVVVRGLRAERIFAADREMATLSRETR